MNSNIHSMLKSATANMHERIENLNPLSKPSPSIEDYSKFLSSLFQVISPMESLLAARTDWNSIGLHYESRNRAHLLAADLLNLGIDPIALPASTQIPHLATIAEALGALYVIEGSTLGGQVLFKKLSSIHGSNIGGAMEYLNGNGKDTLLLWRDFLSILSKFSLDHSDQNPHIIRSALETFECFEYQFKR